jgi:uncharacterized membrane protein
MISLFGVLLVLHVLGATVMAGLMFITPIIRSSARTAGQLRFVFHVTHKLKQLPLIGGAVLLITGIWLMIISKTGVSQMWLDLSILLLILMVVIINAAIEPRMKKIIDMVASGHGEDLPSEYRPSMKKIMPWESAAQLLMVAVFVLMVMKPF